MVELKKKGEPPPVFYSENTCNKILSSAAANVYMEMYSLAKVNFSGCCW